MGLSKARSELKRMKGLLEKLGTELSDERVSELKQIIEAEEKREQEFGIFQKAVEGHTIVRIERRLRPALNLCEDEPIVESELGSGCLFHLDDGSRIYLHDGENYQTWFTWFSTDGKEQFNFLS